MNVKLTKLLTSRFLNIQLLLNCLNSVIGGYAVIYLKFKGFTSIEIGFILSLAAILSIIVQPLVASFADNTNKFTLRQIVMFVVVLNCLLCFVLLLGGQTKSIILLLFILISAVHSTISPLTNSLVIEFINKGILINYGLTRGIGSFAFAVTSILVGTIIGMFNPNILIILGILFYILELISVYFFRLLPDQAKSLASPPIMYDVSYASKQGKDDLMKTSSTFSFLKKYKKFTVFLLGLVLMYYSYLIINTYFINIFENVGGGSRELGIGLAIAATLELPIMAIFTLLLRRFKCSSMIKFAAIFYLIKSLVTLFAPSIAMLYFSQTLQFFSFGLFTPASLYYVNTIIPPQDSVKGQTMINVATFGLSAVLANLTGGILQETVGIFNMLLIATIVTGIGVAVVIWTTEDTGDFSNQRLK